VSNEISTTRAIVWHISTPFFFMPATRLGNI
jgi:hypothetical protein